MQCIYDNIIYKYHKRNVYDGFHANWPKNLFYYSFLKPEMAH